MKMLYMFAELDAIRALKASDAAAVPVRPHALPQIAWEQPLERARKDNRSKAIAAEAKFAGSVGQLAMASGAATDSDTGRIW